MPRDFADIVESSVALYTRHLWDPSTVFNLVQRRLWHREGVQLDNGYHVASEFASKQSRHFVGEMACATAVLPLSTNRDAPE